MNVARLLAQPSENGYFAMQSRTRVLVVCGRRGRTPVALGGTHEEVVETHPRRHWNGIDLGGSVGRRWRDHDARVSTGNR